MATIANLDILLNLKSSIGKGLRNARKDLQGLSNDVAKTNLEIAKLRFEKSLLPRRDRAGRRAINEQIRDLRELALQQRGSVIGGREHAQEVGRQSEAVGRAVRKETQAKREALKQSILNNRLNNQLDQQAAREKLQGERQLARNTRAIQRGEEVRSGRRRPPGGGPPRGPISRLGGLASGAGLAPFRAGLRSTSAALRAFRVDLGAAYYHAGPFSFRVGPAAGAVIALATALKSVSVSAVQTAAEFEQAEVAFEVMTGSAEKAQEVLQKIYQFAAVTPFEIVDVRKAVQQFTAVGIEANTAFEMVERLGNIAAAMPEGMADNLNRVVRALAQMHAKGTVQAEEMTRQLSNAGIPAWQALADKIGISVPEAMDRARRGMIPAYVAMEAILELAASPRFANMQARQAQTMIGLWSTVKDNVMLLMNEIGKAVIKGFDLKGASRDLIGFFEFLRSKVAEFEPLLLRVGIYLRATFGVALSLVQKVVDELGRLTKDMSNVGVTVLQVKLRILDALETLVVGIVGLANRMQVSWGNLFVGMAAGLKIVTMALHVAAIAALAFGHAKAIAWGAGAGGPLGAAAAAAAYMLIADRALAAMKAGRAIADNAFDMLRDFGGGFARVDLQRGIPEVRAFFNDLKVGAIAQADVAKGARLVAAGFMPMGHAIQAAADNLVQFNGEAKKLSLLKFGDLGRGIHDFLKTNRTDMQKFKDDLKEIGTPARTLVGQFGGFDFIQRKRLEMLEEHLEWAKKMKAQGVAGIVVQGHPGLDINIADTIRETTKELDKLKAKFVEIKATGMFAELVPHKQIAANLAGIAGGLGFVGLKGHEAVENIRRAEEGLQNARARMFLKRGREMAQSMMGKDTPALVSGSPEAVNAINKALNDQQRGQMSLEQIMRMMHDLEKQEAADVAKMRGEMEKLNLKVLQVAGAIGVR